MSTTKSKLNNGRPPRMKDIKRARELKRKKLSVREISWAILHREDTKTIHRWTKGDSVV